MKKIVLFFLGGLMAFYACEKSEDESFNASEKSAAKSSTFLAVKDSAFIIVEEMPEFPGGMEALQNIISNSVIYPEAAKTSGVEGRVYLTFVVEKDGSIGDAKVVRSVELSLDNEALRVVKNLPSFKPGKEKGQIVRVKFTIPINFSLGGEAPEKK